MSGRDAYLQEVGAAIDAASVVSGDVAASPGAPGDLPDGVRDGGEAWADGPEARALPDFEWAIVERSELPRMPAEVIEGVLLETHKMLLTGPSKAGKTWCLINLAVSVATGGWWIDFKCAQRKVLYVDLETDPRTLQRRVSRVAEAKGAAADEIRGRLALWPLRGRSCGLAEIATGLFSRCSAGDFGMVIIDPAYMVQDGDENNARDIREFFARLDEICVRLQCTVVISHHHSKGAQGLKSAIDRGSGSGVFGRAPDAVLDLTELVLNAGVVKTARESNRLAEARHLTGWRMSFTLREFAHREPLDVWFAFPLHVKDATGLLADCRPNFGGTTEARRARQEAENSGKLTATEAVVAQLMGPDGYALRQEVADALNCSDDTVKRRIKRSKRFVNVVHPVSGYAAVAVRPDFGAAAPADVAASSGLRGQGSDDGKGAQGEIPGMA